MTALTAAQLATLAQALDDAIDYREPGWCADCEREHGGLCYDHAADAGRCDAYRALAAALAGLEDGRRYCACHLVTGRPPAGRHCPICDRPAPPREAAS
jgi:hypothetical protein